MWYLHLVAHSFCQREKCEGLPSSGGMENREFSANPTWRE